MPRLPSAKTILLAAASLFYAVFIARTAFRVAGAPFFTLIDDAMISMRYAQHLAAGSGLVWNVGATPVEGFTNLGWTLVMALMHLLPISPAFVSLGVMILAAAILVSNVAVVYAICRALQPKAHFAPLTAAIITAFYFPLVFWSLRGMEVGLLTLLISLAVLHAVREPRHKWRSTLLISLFLAVAVAVRLDAALQAIIVVGYILLRRRTERGKGAVLLAIVVLVVASILAFQAAYFGDPLPNTYYLKMAGSTVLERVQNGILVFNDYAARDVLMMVVVSALGIWFYRELHNREMLLLAALFATQCVYSIWVGGDYAEPEIASANRFIAQGVPALIIIFSIVCDRLLSDVLRSGTPSRSPAIVSSLVAFAALLVVSGTPWFNWIVDNAPLLKADIRRVHAGLAIAENTDPSAVIAVHAAGQIPYYSGRTTIDLLGLNDPVIAKGPRSGAFYPGHDKWNYDYSIGQLRPDLIADNWIRLGDYIKVHPDYRELGNRMYVRLDTTLVDESGLVDAYP
ncbi:MAG TPA: glycosyltransferase 87 family protein [Anaerolineales bacterium]